MARDVERGNIGNQREASGAADDLVVRTVLSGALRLSASGSPLPDPALDAPINPLREDHFAEKTSVGEFHGICGHAELLLRNAEMCKSGCEAGVRARRIHSARKCAESGRCEGKSTPGDPKAA